ncbi:MAG: putative toxin-antitoxin system toxin component, PIN family [Acidobacteriota bacterium]
MKVVLDANQFVSAVLVPYGHPARILKAWRQKRFGVAISPAIVAEIRRVLNYPRLQRKHGWSRREVEDFLSRVAAVAEIVPVGPDLHVVTDDPTDDMYVACAVTAGARYIISGDEHLKELKRYRGIEIFSPSDFIRQVLGELPSARPRRPAATRRRSRSG